MTELLSDFVNSVYLPYRNVDSAHYIDVYMKEGGYQPLFNPLAGEKLSRARFVTRNGHMLESYWKRMVLPPTRPRAILTSLATIEPGMFTTKRLVARNPHGLIEGMLLAARAVGADHGIIVTALEDISLAATIDRALVEAKKENFWGKEANWSFELRQVRLPKSAMYGHDPFLLAALHGQRPGFPNRMEFLYGEPVHIHRPEEFYAFSWIERFDEDKFSSKGSLSTPGTYLVAISGNVPNSIVVEVPGGTKLESILNVAGIDLNENQGWFRFGGTLGQWHRWEQVKELPFELSFGPLKLEPFQYPNMEWYSDEGARSAKRSMAHFISHQSCGACLGCSHAGTSLEVWSSKEQSSLAHLAKCSFLPLAINAAKGPAW